MTPGARKLAWSALLLMTLVCSVRPGGYAESTGEALARVIPQSSSEGWYRSGLKTSCSSECEKGGLICDDVIFNTKVNNITTQQEFETMYSTAFLNGQNFSCTKLTVKEKSPERAPLVVLPKNNVSATTAAKCVTLTSQARCENQATRNERRLCYCSVPTPTPPSEGWYRSGLNTNCFSECEKRGLICDDDIFDTEWNNITTKQEFETMYSTAFLKGQNFSCNKLQTVNEKSLKGAPLVVLPKNNVYATTAAKCVTLTSQARCENQAKRNERRLCYCSAPTPAPTPPPPTPTPPPPAPTPTPTPPLPAWGRRRTRRRTPTPSCGVKGTGGPSARIVGGGDAASCEWVWQVSLQKRFLFLRAHICGGVLLTADRVLTAAHCVKDDNLVVVSGLYSKFGFGETTSLIDAKFIHEQYDPERHYNDIAILHLKSPVDLGDCVGTVCLPDQDVDLRALDCWITGWGATKAGGGLDSISIYLKEAKMEVVDFETCKKQWGNEVRQEDICIQSEGSSACDGDSGGPLVCDMNSGWTVFGVTSRATDDCTSDEYPNLYAGVRAHYNWIKDKLERQS